ncbi:MAG TPA: hypothetical protein PK006_05600 [Saprospiraceae bacterium]|nr:hypothetical protein [Saprospiraceae bacterium]
MKQSLIVAIILSYTIALSAQFSIAVTRPNELSLKSVHIWNCMIVNQSNTTADCYLHGIVTENKQGKLGEANSAVFKVPVGVMDINSTNYEVLLPEELLYKNKQYEEHILRTNALPNGEYTICLTLHDAQTKSVLSRNCLSLSVNHVTPSSLITPFDKSEICEPNPLFTWTPYRGGLENTSYNYKIKIVEILDGQKANSAIRTNPCFFCESDIENPFYQYSIAGLSFKEKQKYAWYIAVVDGKKELSVSPVWTFTWKECGNVQNEESGNNDEEEEKDKTPENLKIQGRNYFFLSHFGQAQDVVTINGNKLNFYFENRDGMKKIEYSILDSNKSPILVKDSEVHDSYNYFTADLDAANVLPDKKYTLRILCDNAEQYFLTFSIQKQ